MIIASRTDNLHVMYKIVNTYTTHYDDNAMLSTLYNIILNVYRPQKERFRDRNTDRKTVANRHLGSAAETNGRQ